MNRSVVGLAVLAAGVVALGVALGAVLGVVMGTDPPEPQVGRAPAPEPSASPAWPGPATSGVPDGVRLEPSASRSVEEDGAVLDGLDVRGSIQIRAHDVTIRRTRVASRGHALIRVHPGFAGTLIEDVELDGLGSTATDGVVGSHLTVRRADIHGVVDGVKVGSHSRYEDNWIHDLASGDGAHPDGMQALQGERFVIRGNVIDAPASRGGNSALLLKADAGPIRDAVVEGNRLSGGNYTVYVIGAGNDSTARHPVERVTFRRNVYGEDYRYGLRSVAHVDALTWADDEEWHS